MIRCAMRRLLPLTLVFCLALPFAVRPAAAEIQEYTEDFRSWQQRDPAFTTALWDTTAGELRLVGTWRDVPVDILLWSESTDDVRSYYTTATASFPVPLRMGLRLSPQISLGRAVRELVGAQDLATGDREFDGAFRLQAHDHTRARALLQDDRLRRALHVARSQVSGRLIIQDDGARNTRSGWKSSAMLVSRLPERCLRSAKVPAGFNTSWTIASEVNASTGVLLKFP